MFCSKCGSLNDDSNKYCQSCGESLVSESNESSSRPNSSVYNDLNLQMPTFSSGHSIFLIVFSLLCCGGIVGVIFAIMSLVEGNKVNDYAANGDLENALICKKNSDKWIKATYITWAVVAVLLILYFIIMFASVSMLNY